MSSYLPCGTYMESYETDHRWWRTPFIKFKMVLMVIILIVLPFCIGPQWLTVLHMISYYILAGLGVQLLIGYCGQITLGHAAFVAVGGYCSAIMVTYVPWPQWMHTAGIAYPISIVCAAFMAGIWSVLFGLPSAKVKGFYLILTTMAAQWITVDFIIMQYVSKIGERQQALEISRDALKVGPVFLKHPTTILGLTIGGDIKIYFFSVVLIAICLLFMGNMVRSKVGRAWIAIRDNDIAAETMGVNIVWYKFLAFFVAGFFAGVAGAFDITRFDMISPENYPWSYSLIWVGVILIGGVGSIQGLVFGAIFVIGAFELIAFSTEWIGNDFVEIVQQFSDRNAELAGFWGWLATWSGASLVPALEAMSQKVAPVKDMAFGLAIIGFLIYEPNGLGYRYWQLKNYFNLWPFSYHGK